MRTCVSFLLVVTALALMPAGRAQDLPELERILNTEYRDKVVVQRQFLSGSKLEYAADGAPRSTNVGSWTTDAQIQVEKIRFPNDRQMEIRGKRRFLAFDNVTNQFMDPVPADLDRLATQDERFRKLRQLQSVTLIITSAGPWTEAEARAALGKVFLRADEQLSGFVPDYWKPFLRERKLFGAAPVSREGGPAPAARPLATPTVGPGVEAPKIKSAKDPDYSEVARWLHYSGVTVLGLVVGPDGQPHDTRVVRALGAGLDDQAVQSVMKWRFKPAIKGGEPLAVQISGEVNFRLY